VAGFHFEDLPSGKVEVSVHDPTDPLHRVYLSTCPHAGRVPAVKMISVHNSTTLPLPPSAAPTIAPHMFLPFLPANPSVLVFKYKHVDQKVQPVTTTLPKEFHNVCHILEDPLLTLPPLPTTLPNFMPGECLMQDHLDTLALPTTSSGRRNSSLYSMSSNSTRRC